MQTQRISPPCQDITKIEPRSLLFQVGHFADHKERVSAWLPLSPLTWPREGPDRLELELSELAQLWQPEGNLSGSHGHKQHRRSASRVAISSAHWPFE